MIRRIGRTLIYLSEWGINILCHIVAYCWSSLVDPREDDQQ